jgi:hypothetical protein
MAKGDVMKVHELETWPEPFADVMSGRKRFEIRRDDRGFEVGDIVVLREFIPDDHDGGYTGAASDPFRIGYVCRSKCIPDGYCGFSLVKLVPEMWRKESLCESK